MKVKIKKLFHGLASVRSYLVKEAYYKGEDLVIDFDGDTMTIPYKDIPFVASTNGLTFKSIHDDREYTLWDFRWKPSSIQEKLISF